MQRQNLVSLILPRQIKLLFYFIKGILETSNCEGGQAVSAMYTVSEIKNIVCPLAKEYGAERIYLFGSYARGDSTKDSDIDLRIDKGSIRGLALAGLLLDLEAALGCQVDLITTTSLDKEFLSRIKKDEVLLYEAS